MEMRLTNIQKPTVLEEELFLSAMIETIMRYHNCLAELERRYEEIKCSLISPCYFNFRDAVFHYEKAYKQHETIQLYCEQNAMQEHLHRALKDGCVEYLQLVNERLNILYTYACTPERYQLLEKRVTLIACKAGMTMDELKRVGIDIFDLVKVLPSNITFEEYQIICEYIFNLRFVDPYKKRMEIQKAFHNLRNMELNSRNASMNIGKPFSIEVPKENEKAPIDFFFESCDREIYRIRKIGLMDFLIAAKVLQNKITLAELKG